MAPDRKDTDNIIVNNMFQSISDEVRENSTAISELSGQFKGLAKSVDSLVKIVSGGNGVIPLITKVALLEDQLKNVNMVIDNRIGAAAEKDSALEGKRSHDNRELRLLRAQVWAAIIPACLSLIIAILTFIYQ